VLFVNHTASAGAAKDYFTRQLSSSDYYLRDSPEITGEWHGLGAELLGLAGPVDKEAYFRLCDNLHPISGEQLTPRTKAQRRILYDFTFDAPKGVSLAYELGGDERILDAFRASVRETMAEMESAMMARVRSGGADADRPTSNLVWAEFIHRTTRPLADGLPDPQLHCHAVAFNCTYDSVEERWKAGQFSNLVRDKGYYQAAFHSRLAGRFVGLGYGIERDGNSFRLAGIERATCEKFSRRTEIIEAEAQRLGITNAKAKGELGRRTRQRKTGEGSSISELRGTWNKRITQAERQAIIAARSGQETRTLNAVQAMDYSISHCFERESVVTEKELLKHALMESVGRASVLEVQSEGLRSNIIRRDRSGQRYVTTKDVYREELAMVAFAREGRGQYRKLGGGKTPSLDPQLSREQCDAALVILNSRDRVTGLKGGAGTGKTRMMQAAVEAIEGGGKRVYTFAPSAEASRNVLRSEGFAEAETVEKLLTDAKLQERVKGQVLWIDEAGLLSVKDMKRLFDLAKSQECRMVLSGDSRQHNAVVRGDALRLLEKEAGMKFATLKQVRRQTDYLYRQAVTSISEGDTLGKGGRTQLEAGIEMLDRMGAIIETAGEERYRQIAADYVAVTSEHKTGGVLKTALVVSPTHAEAERVTTCVREQLRNIGRIGGNEREVLSLRAVNFTEAQRGQAGNYRPGHVVQFHQNAKGFKRGERVRVVDSDATGVRIERSSGTGDKLPISEARKFQVYEAATLALAVGDKVRITQNGFTRESKRGLKKSKDRLNNGAVYDVEGFTREGDIRLSNGFIVPKDYGGIGHGYCHTSHASQGKSVDVVLVAVGQESFAAANRQQLYVSISRGKEAARLYTDDKAVMLAAVRGSAARLSATEMMQEQAPKPRRTFGMMRRLFTMQRIQSTYAALRERVLAPGGRQREEVRLGGR
jgi:conjugative relaxase-like TrwC/TraI family protein